MSQKTDKQEAPLGYNKVNFFIIVKGGASKFIEFIEKVFNAIENKKARIPDKDGTLIHSEVSVGDSMILIADSKEDWLFTPAFPQVYVDDAQEILNRAEKEGAKIITPVSDFYYGLKLARFQDEWGNIWWLFERGSIAEKTTVKENADLSWQDKKPSQIYITLMEAMKDLGTRQYKKSPK